MDYHYQMSPWISSFLAISIVSGIPLAVTLLLATQKTVMQKAIPQLTAFGAGALLGAATLHVIPESLRAGRSPMAVFVGVVAGYVAFALVERLLASHDHAHAHGIELGAPEKPASAGHGHSHVHRREQGAPEKLSGAGHDHSHAHRSDEGAPGKPSALTGGDSHSHEHKSAAALVPLAFVGDAVHNLVDGMLIAAGFLTDPAFGFLTALAIGLHELPREVGTFGLFVHGGVAPMRAVGYNVITAGVSFLGAAVTLLVGANVSRLADNILPFAAGSYLYIAVAVGIPALARRGGRVPLFGRAAGLAAGFALMSVSALL